MLGDLSPEQRRWRWRIFLLTWLAYAGFYLCRKNFSVAMPYLMEDLGYDGFDLAHILFAYSALYMLGQFGNGMLSDKVGPRFIVGIGMLASLALSVVVGLSSALLIIGTMYALNGYAQATGWPGTVKNMSTWFRQHERGRVMGWWCSCYVIGGLIAGVVATYCASNSWFFPELGWRRAFLVPAALLLLIALAYVIFTRNRPRDAGLPDFPEESPGPEPAAGLVPRDTSVLREVLASPALWIAGSTYFFLKMLRYIFVFWLPVYMVNALSYEKATAGYASNAYEFVGFFGVLLAGYASDRFFGSRRFPVCTIMLLGLAGACLLHPYLATQGLWLTVLGIGLIGMLTFGPDSILAGAAAQDIGSQRGAATAAGVINGMGSAGQMLHGYVVAFVTSHYGWDALFYLFVGFGLITAALTATMWQFGRAATTKPVVVVVAEGAEASSSQ